MMRKRPASDIINNVPSDVTEHILKYLPLRDAVRTSVLSTGWRYKWATLPLLVFDGEFFVTPWDTEKLKAIICQILLLHQGPLIEFKLYYPPFQRCLDINNWILILLKKNVQKFTLYLHAGPRHVLPCHIFSFLQVRHLNLANCVFKPPPTFLGFSRLVKLNLLYVTIAPKILVQFISNCPLLERLRVRHCTHFDFLEINAPNLKVFEFMGSYELVSFKNVPLLVEISITLLSWDSNVKQLEEGRDSDWVKFFRRVPAIEDLHLDSSVLETWAAGIVPTRLPITLSHLKVLVLSDVCYYNLDHVACAFCLFRSSPNLQKVNFSILNRSPLQDPVVEFLQVQDFSNFSLNQLREVTIRHFTGADPEMHFVKILLAHSTVLKKMEILYDPDISDEEGFAMVKELTRFPRASPKAEVIMYMAPDLQLA